MEGLVGYARRNFPVPVPVVAGFAALNAQLERRCLERLDHRVRGHAESFGERLERDLAALQSRPPAQGGRSPSGSGRRRTTPEDPGGLVADEDYHARGGLRPTAARAKLWVGRPLHRPSHVIAAARRAGAPGPP